MRRGARADRCRQRSCKPELARDEHPRIPGKGAAGEIRRRGAARRGRLYRGRGGEAVASGSAASSGRSRRRSMPAGAARRAGSSWRNRPKRRGAAATRAMLGKTPGHPPDRAPGPRGQAGLCRGRPRHRPRALSRRCRSTAPAGASTLIAAAEGGVEIEEVAARAPEKIMRMAIDPASGHRAVPCPPARLRPRPRGRPGRRR